MSAPTLETRLTVMAREDYRCAACGSEITGAWSLQHRRPRGMGSTKRAETNEPPNLLLVCGTATSPGGCHQAMESHVAWAFSKGYRVRQTADPATVPVWVARQGWVYLTPEGGYLPAKDPHPEETRVLDRVSEALRDLDSAS